MSKKRYTAHYESSCQECGRDGDYIVEGPGCVTIWRGNDGAMAAQIVAALNEAWHSGVDEQLEEPTL